MARFMENPDEVASMASKARSMITDRYEHDDVMQALLKMYQELG